jgi:hypothetical protein
VLLSLKAAAFVVTAGMAGGGGAYLVGQDQPQHPPSAHSPSQRGPACATPVGRAVCKATADPHVRTAMRLGALLEGGNLHGPWACGDHGWSCGPWQINRSVHHGVSRAEAADPAWAARFMLGAYRTGCASVPAATWRLSPRAAAATCVFRAERPAVMYSTARVRVAWARLGGH